MKPADNPPDSSKESFVIEDSTNEVTFENDGTSVRKLSGRIRIQSDAGLQRFGVLTFQYQKSTETFEIDTVRVLKKQGAPVSTPPDTAQDIDAEITRQAPLYSDLREKHIAVKGLSVGDTVEYQAHWAATKPLAPGQFWGTYSLGDDGIILHEKLLISTPRERPVKWKSVGPQPVVTEAGARRLFTWNASHLTAKTPEDEKKAQELTASQAVQGKLPQPDIQISSFQSWDEVGRWYSGLQQDRIKPTDEIRAKAAELTRNLIDDDAKLRAIYRYVSTQFRYIGVDFGIGRYQPHFATDVLANQFGDCKDKHTLLSSLLAAAGIVSYPALVNSSRDIDSAVPSPAQFDHVITLVSLGKSTAWLDTTPEVAPYAYLLSTLRGKPALAIPPDRPASLIQPPADESRALQTFRFNGTLSDAGVLTGKMERSFRGDDSEVLIRAAFRRTPATQWKALVQQFAYATGFAGDVSDVVVSAPDKTEEAFQITCSYTRKDFPDWPNHKVASALPPVPFPEVTENGPAIWLGQLGEMTLQSEVKLPPGYRAQLPKSIDLVEDFAEYHASYSYKNSILTTSRRFVVKMREVPAAELEAYKKLSKAGSDDQQLMVPVSSGAASPYNYQEEIWTLSFSSNSDANKAYDDAVEKWKKNDASGQISSLQQAITLDPKFTRAYLWLGEVYRFQQQDQQAIEMYRKAIAIEPDVAVSYKALAATFLLRQKFADALPVWKDLIRVAPDDPSGYLGEATVLAADGHHAEAIPVLEAGLRVDPEESQFFYPLAKSYLKVGDTTKALVYFKKAVEKNPVLYNDAGYELADANQSIDVALEYARKAVAAETASYQKTDLTDPQLNDLSHTVKLCMYWDTLGWVLFRQGKAEEALLYLTPAWQLSQQVAMAGHLGQVYEQQNKKRLAEHYYRLALAANLGMAAKEKAATFARLQKLNPGAREKDLQAENAALDEINRLRTLKLPRLVPVTANADVLVLVGLADTHTVIKAVKFLKGSDELKSSESAIRKAPFPVQLPPEGNPVLLMRGIVGCFPASGCSLILTNPADMRLGVN